MKPLTNLDEFFDGDLYLPWRGKKWRVPEPSASEVQRLQSVIYSETIDLEYESRRLMGETWNVLVDEGIGVNKLKHMGITALIWFGLSPQAGEAHWHLAQVATLINLDDVIAATKKYQEATREH